MAGVKNKGDVNDMTVEPTHVSAHVPDPSEHVAEHDVGVSLAALFMTAPKDGYPSGDEPEVPTSSGHHEGDDQGEGGGDGGEHHEDDGQGGSDDNSGDDEDDDDSDPSDPEPEEPTTETSECEQCILLKKELNLVCIQRDALEVVVGNNFKQPLPADRLDLVHRLDEIKKAMNGAKFRLEEMRRENNYQFAIYAKCRSTNTTKMTHMPQSSTVSKMKEEVMVLFGYPKVSRKERTFEILEGALTYIDGRKVTPPLRMLTKDENRKQLKSLMSHTVLIEFSERIKGGGVMRTISKDSKVTKRDFIEKAQKDMCDKVKDKEFGIDLKSEKAVLDYIMNFSGSPAELFKVAVDAMDEPMALEFQKLLSDAGKNGSTEDKIENFTSKVLGARFRKLDAVIADCENLKSALVLSMVKKYADWSLKGSRFDNSSLLHVISTRLANLKGSGASTTDVAKAFQDMQIE